MAGDCGIAVPVESMKHGSPRGHPMSMLKTVAVIAGVLVGVNAMSQTTTNSVPKETVTLGGGCFWCTEAGVEDLKGVEKVESGYSGGTVPNPTYEQVSTGDTGHAEVSQ